MSRRGVPAAGLLRWVMLAVAFPCAAEPCMQALPDGTRLESGRYALVFRTQPAAVVVGSHFAVEFSVCPKSDAPPPQSVRVDAHMPAHRHGMNYAPQVARTADGRYLATGLMFHMPGRWEFVFDLRAGDKTDRLNESVTLE